MKRRKSSLSSTINIFFFITLLIFNDLKFIVLTYFLFSFFHLYFVYLSVSDNRKVNNKYSSIANIFNYLYCPFMKYHKLFYNIQAYTTAIILFIFFLLYLIKWFEYTLFVIITYANACIRDFYF